MRMTEKTPPTTSPVPAEDVVVVPIDELDEEAAALDPVRLYLNAIGKVPLLTAEQEVDLAQRIEAGLYAQHKLDSARGRRLSARTRADLTWLAADGRRAKEQLLQANLRLVVSVAKKYARPTMPFL